MAHWGKGSSRPGGNLGKRPVVPAQEKTGGLPKTATVRGLIKQSLPNLKDNEFYELEMAEVISIFLDVFICEGFLCFLLSIVHLLMFTLVFLSRGSSSSSFFSTTAAP